MKKCLFVIALFSTLISAIYAQAGDTPDFRVVANAQLKKIYGVELAKVCPIESDTVAERVFRDYGAIFISNNNGVVSDRCIFEDEATVKAFQAGAGLESTQIGGVNVTLQKAAMKALLDARAEGAKLGLSITPRGGATASTRSYTKTADLWASRFLPGLNRWVARGKIKPAEAAAARNASIRKQVEAVLAWEAKGWWFNTDFTKSILYSVAAPGASQHIFGLALDVEQFGSPRVRQLLARHGWIQTVKSDLPDFTVLWIKDESGLKAAGLVKVVVGGQDFWIPNM